jgi:hypothetical protein
VRNNIYVYGIRGEGKSATHRAGHEAGFGHQDSHSHIALMTFRRRSATPGPGRMRSRWW